MNDNLSRRTFFRSLCSKILSLAPVAALVLMAWRYLAMPFKIKLERKVPLGLLAELSPGTQVLRNHGIALVRKEDTIRAVGLTCTHLGCTVNRAAGGFVCPCHGSRFDAGGRVQSGPASRDLERFAVEISSDRRVMVDLGQPEIIEK